MEFNPTDNRVVSLAAHQLLRERKFHCILTTYPPMGSLALADQLSRRYGVPWIADLRDIPDEIDTGRVHWRTRRAVNALEAACASASHLVTVSEPLAERLRRDYRLARPVTTIYNGFEVDDIVHVEGKQPSDSIFRITYCGSFGYGRSLSLLQRSLRLLKIRGCSLDGVEIHIYGSRRSPSDWSDDICPDVPIKFHGRVPHETALRAESASAILLSLASPGAQGILTSKIFEYAMVGRPVLSIPADSGALDEFIRNAEIGLASSDPEEIATLIARHICEWRRTGALPVVVPNRDYLSAFSRRAQAARLVELVQVLLGRPQAP